MTWINKDELIQGVARFILVDAALVAAFGKQAAESYDVVHRLDSFTFGLRDRVTGEIVASQAYDPQAPFTGTDVLAVLENLKEKLAA